MELDVYNTRLARLVNAFDDVTKRTHDKCVKGFIKEVRGRSPVDTGDLLADWKPIQQKRGSAVYETRVETNPVHHGVHYASLAEKYYDTHVANSKGLNSQAYRFRKLAEAVWRQKADQFVQDEYERSFNARGL